MFFPAVIYLELFIALFFLPGFFITVIMGMKKFRFLLSFALSYSILVLTLLPFEFYAQPIVRWSAWVQWEWIILAVLAVVKILINKKNISTSIRVYFESRLALSRLMVPLVLAVVICGYLAYAGPYLEMPADAWEHVRRFRWFETGALEEGAFASGSSLMTFLFHHLRWYFIHAWLCHVSGLPVIDSLRVLTFVNVLVFLMAIYYFGLFLFAGLRVTVFKKMMMAACASLFAVATMGNMVFAYIRYYAFAPTILNYVLFLSAMAIIIAWLRSNRWFGKFNHGWCGHAFWVVPILLLVTSLIHAQETLFIFFMTMSLGLLGCLSFYWREFIYGNFAVVAGGGDPGPASPRPATVNGQFVHGSHCSAREWKPVILCSLLIIAFFAGFAAVRYFKPGSWISANMILPNVSLPPGPVSLIFRDLMITPPQNSILRLAAYQLFIFYQVIGCWGLFVYLLFLLMIRRFIKMPYLVAGMIIVPILTTFNPLTVDMMARLGQDPTIYRFHYLIPLPFVGGYLFVIFWNKAWGQLRRIRLALAKSGSPIQPRLVLINYFVSILVLAGLIVFVFPINAVGIYAPYSKIYTLRKIPAGNDYRLYDDLGKFIAKYENKVILSDGWTSGFLWCFSPKNTYGWLRWFSSLNPEKDQPEPYTWENLRNRGLIVVNCRDGAPSITGKIAKHWPEDILKISRLYSPEARNYLESHPEKFQKIWSQNRIAVYAVR